MENFKESLIKGFQKKAFIKFPKLSLKNLLIYFNIACNMISNETSVALTSRFLLLAAIKRPLLKKIFKLGWKTFRGKTFSIKARIKLNQSIFRMIKI